MKRSRNVLLLVLFLTISVAFLVCVNVFAVTVGHYHFASKTDLTPYIDKSNVINDVLHAQRGYIFDADGVVVAQDEDTYDVICFMDESRLGIGESIAYVDDIEKTANALASCLEVEVDDIRNLLVTAKSEGMYQTELGLAGKNISKEKKLKIEEYNLNGIEFRPSKKRNYTYGADYSPYLIGFAQADENNTLVGKMGVEQYLNSELTGINGKRTYQSDKNGYILPGMREEIVEAKDGYNVYLTLDSAIQEALQQSLDDMVDVYKAESAWGGVLNIKNGKILGWGQSPNFDPNLLNVKDYNNYGSQKVYEPGSVFKPFTYAAAIDTGKYDGNKLVDSSTYCFYSDENNNPVRTYNSSEAVDCINNANFKQWGMMPYDYGLIYSSNTMTATLISDVITPDVHLDYLNRFHLLDRVDTDGIMENDVSINHHYAAEKVTASYGHGVTSTMLRLMQAYTAIFGNGEMIKPYYIDKIVDPYDSNKVIYEGQREVVEQPIKAETAKQLQDILHRVVTDERGTGQRYRVEGIEVMAKTGTTKVANEGKYDDNGRTIFSVMLGFPYEDPQYMIYFAYETAYYDKYYYTTDEPITRLISKVALVENLNSDVSGNTTVSGDIHEYPMPQLLNHNINYATDKLNPFATNVIKLGDGNSVIAQSPSYGQSVFTNQKVFLLTSKDNVVMPDMQGWTRKEIMQFFSLLNVDYKIEGSGLAVEQNLEAGTIITNDNQIIITLANPIDPN